MSTFQVKVYKIQVLPHPNADLLELAKVGDYLSAVAKKSPEVPEDHPMLGNGVAELH
jgi:hypothetical protein